jgi:urease gamma subunit
MKLNTLVGFSMLTVGLSLGLAVVISAGMRTIIGANWEKNRCDPGVVITAAAYKPTNDPRTPGQFAEDNWRDCQKEYVQNALRTAAAIPKDLANAEAATAAHVQDMVSKSGDVFFNLWKFIYEAYSTFMDSMKGAAKLFQNFVIQLQSIIERLQASVIAIVFSLIAVIVTFINSIQVALMVAIIVVGILIGMMILLFLVLLPIAPLIVSITALVAVTVTIIAGTLAGSMVSEMYTPGACFTPDTRVVAKDGNPRPLSEVQIGDTLRDGGRVVAVHTFHTDDPIYNLYGVRVTGDHLVSHPETPRRLIAVRTHPDAFATGIKGTHDLICLTTTTRRIPVLSHDVGVVMFADWEEIPESDEESLRAWNRRVWAVLNPGHDYRRPAESVLQSEAGLSPDCQVECPGWLGLGPTRLRRIADLRAGDVVFDAGGQPTRVVGTVVMEGDQTTDAVNLPAADGSTQVVSAATWIFSAEQGIWCPPLQYRRIELHPVRWMHLYTAAGTFRLSGGYAVRDAAEIGLGNLRPLVEDIVMAPSPPPITI